MKYIEKIDLNTRTKKLQNCFLIRYRAWIEATASWPENIFWLEAAAAINGAATVS